jgi:hypothetical protein
MRTGDADGTDGLAPAPKIADDGAWRREPGSYRDRNGAVFYRGERVLRGINAKALRDWRHLSQTDFFRRLMQQERIVPTECAAVEPEAAADWAALLSHQRIPFVSYPYEWPFGMLREAALLHLDLMQAALDEGMILKDASPYNVQWNGAEATFIDIPSFEILEPGTPWIGYRQFCELFLYPLFLHAYKGVDVRPWLRGKLDGITAASMRRLMSTRDLLRPGVMMHVVAQAALQRRYAEDATGVRSTLAVAGFDKGMISRNVAGLRRIVARMRPADNKSVWADYGETHTYDQAEFEAKCAFVRSAVSRRRWPLVWDLGCNTGTFSRIAAGHADYVVAVDGDPATVQRLYESQKDRPDRKQILPLVVDLADPSPNQGWQGTERRSLADRGRPDLTLCLALVHHMVVGANIPMREFIAWLAGLGTSLVIEFVGRQDEMLMRLLANKDDQYSDYHADVFEGLLAEHFDVADKRPLKGGKRTIYLALAKL